MGAWGTNIKDNDTTADIYTDFFEMYNSGQNPADISRKLIKKNKYLINNPDDSNNFWFAIALGQWETKSLEPHIFEKVKEIIESGSDLKVWKELDADNKDLIKRKRALELFLDKLQTTKQKAKNREKPKEYKPIFKTGECLTFKLDNQNYGGAIVLATNSKSMFGQNLVAGTRINQKNKPTVEDFLNAEILIKNFAFWKDEKEIMWINPIHYEKEYSSHFELVGQLQIEKNYDINDYSLNFSHSADWGHSKNGMDSQIEFEKNNPKPTLTLFVSELISRKKWWKFW